MQKVIVPPPLIEEIQETSEKPVNAISPTMIGVICGLIAAVGYTLANIALRSLAETHTLEWQIWVTFMKAVPAALVAWGLIAYRSSKGLLALPPLRMVGPLIVVGLMMQFGGNLAFQWSLTRIDLALTVPLCFSTLICTGAGLGRIFLGEPIAKRTVIAMLSLIISISLISVGIWLNKEGGGTDEPQSWSMTMLAILTACVSGISYGACGVVIRLLVKRLPISASLVTFSTTGVVVLGAISLSSYGIGYEAILDISGQQWFCLWSAGCSNAFAFFAVGAAMKRLEVVRVNLLNAAQVAMCAMAGVFIFSEALTSWLIFGTLLTIFGLILMGMKRGQRIG